ncbi:MAG: hypothetical protein HUJ65_05790, partial [Oscillospiraceae bacterium]|nr:hypothetical protein [Oscillospiraceae bacterium]
HKKDRQWWIKTIAKQKNYCVPVKFGIKSMDCRKAAFTIDGETREQLLALCKKTNVSLNSCLLTIAALTTVRLTGKTNFSTYNMSHGRMTAAQKKTIGCMMYTVPVFYDVPVDDTVVSDFITEKYKDYLASITHARIPYGELVAAMYFKSLKARTFMHEWICLSQMDYRSEGEENDGFKSDAMPHYGLECPIYIGILEGSEDIVLDIAYQSEILTPEQIEELWQAYRSVLCAVAGEPDASVRSIIARR